VLVCVPTWNHNALERAGQARLASDRHRAPGPTRKPESWVQLTIELIPKSRACTATSLSTLTRLKVEIWALELECQN